MGNTGAVMVGYDGSTMSQTAAHWAAREAVARGLPLVLAHAFTPPIGGFSDGYISSVGADVVATMQDSADASLLEMVAALTAVHPQLDVQHKVLVASPSAALIEASSDATLLVVGSRGLGGFRGLILGSVGVQVATHSQCPTVVLRGEPSPSADCVVVGIDNSPLSAPALEFAFDFASRHGLRLLAVHAWDISTHDVLGTTATMPVPNLQELGADEERMASEALAGFRGSYPDVDVEEHLIKGNTAKAIVEAGKNAALIVVGSRGRGELAGAVLGSVSQSVLHKAKIPVAVVHR
ncbi:MAG: universal stress protein [Actinobacteria bacterium]|nr:universal stress protein [Actinomycetota bacterium]